jgi:hypothetical protein
MLSSMGYNVWLGVADPHTIPHIALIWMSLISTMKIKMIDKNIKNEDKNEHISMARKEKPTI